MLLKTAAFNCEESFSYYVLVSLVSLFSPLKICIRISPVNSVSEVKCHVKALFSGLEGNGVFVWTLTRGESKSLLDIL